MTDPIEIKPAAAPLTDAPANRSTTSRVTPAERSGAVEEPRNKLFVPVATVIALAMLYVVFFVLPGMVPATKGADVTPETTTDAEPKAESESSNTPTATPDNAQVVTPFRDAQLARAKEQAEQELATFVELQIELEEKLQVGLIGTPNQKEAVMSNFEKRAANYKDVS